MTNQHSEILTQFENSTLDPSKFRHKEHIQVAFEMLQKYSYLDACTKYANGIKTIANKAGAAKKFNVTITFAFLSLIAERVHKNPQLDLNSFIDQNPDLMSKNALAGLYSSEEISSDFARTHFLLPRYPL